MEYIVFDLEWNQPATAAQTVFDPVYLTGEIVQIGAVKLDQHFRPIDELRLYVLPQRYTKMHRAVASLTGIRDTVLQAQGLPFPDAYHAFSTWCGEEYTFITWSFSDLPILVENMLLHGIEPDFPDCIDLQRIFSREIMRQSRRYSLEDALDILGLQGETAHDALHDARNTVLLCQRLAPEDYLDEYVTRPYVLPEDKRLFLTTAQVRTDPALAVFACPWCGETVKSEPWLRYGGWEQMAFAACPEGDEFLLTLETHRQSAGGYRVKRLAYEMSDDLWELYCDRKEATQPL